MLPRDKIRAALTRGASGEKRSAAKNAPALVAFITAGYPEPSEFLNVLRAVAGAAEVGVSGVIVPDLPYEESAPLRAALDTRGLALVQLVTPATPPERLRSLCAASQGFVYAVTRTGITGGESTLPAETAQYLASVKAASQLPVCAGFGVRRADQVATIARHADGVIVGSALVEVLERGEDPARFLRSLRG